VGVAMIEPQELRGIRWRIKALIARLRFRRRVEPGGPGWNPPPDGGVREPRRPIPTLGAGAMELPEPLNGAPQR
jgi:hypothetical protein